MEQIRKELWNYLLNFQQRRGYRGKTTLHDQGIAIGLWMALLFLSDENATKINIVETLDTLTGEQ